MIKSGISGMNRQITALKFTLTSGIYLSIRTLGDSMQVPCRLKNSTVVLHDYLVSFFHPANPE